MNEIICVHESRGAVHGFELFKLSGVHMHDDILAVLDKGYQGIEKLHKNSLIPFKKPRKGKLTAEEKGFNSRESKFRTAAEHVSRRIKRFKILQQRYRNKQHKHLLRISLICGVYNYELSF
jgi:hypothetical protein